jgi:stalled ribosome rescue protein Dom34
MASRNLHAITLTDEEEAKLAVIRQQGVTIIDIFRMGMAEHGVTMRRLEPAKKTMKKVIATPKDVEKYVEVVGEYGCGCKRVEGKNLCPKHGRY